MGWEQKVKEYAGKPELLNLDQQKLMPFNKNLFSAQINHKIENIHVFDEKYYKVLLINICILFTAK